MVTLLIVICIIVNELDKNLMVCFAWIGADHANGTLIVISGLMEKILERWIGKVDVVANYWFPATFLFVCPFVKHYGLKWTVDEGETSSATSNIYRRFFANMFLFEMRSCIQEMSPTGLKPVLHKMAGTRQMRESHVTSSGKKWHSVVLPICGHICTAAISCAWHQNNEAIQ